MGKVLLFDIDQTLLFTGGAGSRAFTATFEEIWGVKDAFANVKFAGRTDPAIVRDALAFAGIAAGDDGEFARAIERFRERYLEHLRATLPTTPGGRVLPGVPALLDRLKTIENAFVGLATGNFREGARLKLAHYDLGDYFLDGGFGDDAEDRGQMVAAGARRMLAHASVPAGAHEVIVIGDTEHDVNAARVNGFLAVGVGTGHMRRQALLDAGADLAFDDLSDTDAVLAALGLA